MWILLVTIWAAQNPFYAGTYENRTICEAMGHRVLASYQAGFDWKCIEVPK